MAAILAVGCLLGWASRSAAQSFEDEQREYYRVEQAFRHHYDELRELFQSLEQPFPPEEVFFRVIKRDRVIEIWARADEDQPFEAITELPVCYYSGGPGPKRREGDLQHPEGFYTIDRFNPRSHCHLSLRISYPNASDRILGERGNLGGDIYIHGGCGSHGCLAVTDDGAEKLYVLAVLARSNGQRRIPIHIFPARFTEEDLAWLRIVSDDDGLWDFWMTLREGYDYFEEHHRLPLVDVDDEGRYIFSEPEP